MEPPELIRLDTLLRFRLTAAGELLPRPGRDVTEVPRFLVHRFQGGYLSYCRAGLPPSARERLGRLPLDRAFDRPSDVFRVLGQRGGRSVERLYEMNEAATRIPAEGVSRQGNHFVVLSDDRPVAWAWTMEEHARAERGTAETVEAYRRQGHARRALGAWARHVLERRKVALVAHPDGDVPSRQLLRSLGANEYAWRAVFP